MILEHGYRILKFSKYSRRNAFHFVRTFCQDSSSDEESKISQAEREKKKEEAKKKMNELLQSLTKKTHINMEPVNIAQAKKQPRVKKSKKSVDQFEDDVIDFSMKKAVKDVAHALEGDAKETESELLSSLRSHTASKRNLQDLITGMKIMPKAQKEEDEFQRKVNVSEEQSYPPKSRLHKYRKGFMRDRSSDGPVNLFGSPPLGIFSTNMEYQSSPLELETWETAAEKEKQIAILRSPKNYFDELIKWTEEGKLWQFPIDNEIGLEEERQYSFADHIFLEKHIQDWCPKKGPVKNFMELVCVGLSKNPYLTVTRKKSHLEWYRDYFDQKKEILQSVGAM